MRIGVTGHQRLKDPNMWVWVEREMDRLLATLPSPPIGITSLAIGADQLFANAVLCVGGSLEVVVPFAGYESKFTDGDDRLEYERLLRRAAAVELLEKQGSDEEAYFAAGKRVVDISDLVLAVWDGKPAAGLGGTGDVVEYAMEQGIQIVHFNPIRRGLRTLRNTIDKDRDSD